MYKDKKALTLNQLYPAVLAIVLVGIVLGIGLYVMDQVRDEVASNYAGSDTDAYANGSAQTGASNTTTLGDSTATNYKLQTVSVVNATTNAAITNYTWTEDGVISWGADVSLGGDTANITSAYTYDAPNSGEAAMATASTGLAGLASWIAIIVVVIAAAVVLGIVLSSFGREPGV